MNTIRKLLYPFYEIYFLAIALPLIVATTILAAVITIIVLYIFGDKRWTYYPGLIWARVICALTFVRMDIKGGENFDSKKSYIFLCNHQSIYDVFVIYGWLYSRFKWIMKQELRKIPFVGAACEAAGHIFINRESAIKSNKSMLQAEQKLKHGASIVMFPEGHRTRDGKLQQFKRGAFFMACDLHLPIVPITIKGAYRVFPAGSWFICPGTITVTIHKPIDTTELTHDNLHDYSDKVWNTINSAL